VHLPRATCKQSTAGPHGCCNYARVHKRVRVHACPQRDVRKRVSSFAKLMGVPMRLCVCALLSTYARACVQAWGRMSLSFALAESTHHETATTLYQGHAQGSTHNSHGHSLTRSSLDVYMKILLGMKRGCACALKPAATALTR